MQYAECGVLMWEPVSLGKLCVPPGQRCVCGSVTVWSRTTRGLPSLSQVSWQTKTACLLSHLSVAWSCLVSQACVHVCVCVCVYVWKNRIKSRVCVCSCLTFVLWLVIAGNPSTSQSKKTIKQRFLKLLPCCKPSAAPSISQSKCSFTLYTSLLPSVSADSSVKTLVVGCSHIHTQPPQTVCT